MTKKLLVMMVSMGFVVADVSIVSGGLVPPWPPVTIVRKHQPNGATRSLDAQLAQLHTVVSVLVSQLGPECICRAFDDVASDHNEALVDVFLPYVDVNNALVILAKWGYSEKVEMLLEHPSVIDDTVNEALAEAAQADHCNVIAVLLNDFRITPKGIQEALDSVDELDSLEEEKYDGKELGSLAILQAALYKYFKY